LKRGAVVTRSGRGSCICILTRYPRLGEVKTRLVPPLSCAEALALHDRLARHTLRRALALSASGDARVEVRTDAAFHRVAHDWLGGGFSSRYQGEGDLGDRIRLSFGDAFGRGAGRVAVIGSDCPRLSSAILREAFARLEKVDMVLGPATDGGYYLVALRRDSAKRSVPVLFSKVPWSTADVLARTIEIADEHGLSYALLEELPDVDRPEDVADAEAVLAACTPTPDSRVSVVVPALDDAGCVADAVASGLAAGADEVVVVDGGSRDETRAVAASAGARVLESATGRARQMNAGAKTAIGGVLVFLHADTTLPPHACDLARAALARPGVVAGAFGFAVPSEAHHSRLINTIGRWRARLSGRPYGDQALFLSACTFTDLDGFPDLPTMEDLELVTRLKRVGKVVVLDEPAVTSARAWEAHGLIATTAINKVSISAYHLGVDPERIAGWRARISTRAYCEHDSRD